MHLFQGLLAQKVDSLVHLVPFHLVKSTVLLARADLIKDVLHFSFVPLEHQLLERINKVGLGEGALHRELVQAEIVFDGLALDVARFL